jgi:hypothetical protein
MNALRLCSALVCGFRSEGTARRLPITCLKPKAAAFHIQSYKKITRRRIA